MALGDNLVYNFVYTLRVSPTQHGTKETRHENERKRLMLVRRYECRLGMSLKYNLCFIKYRLYLYKLMFDFIKYRFNFIKYKLYFKNGNGKHLIIALAS